MEEEKYFKKEKGGWVETNQEGALKEGTYGTKAEERGHIYANHTNCNIEGCYTCELGVCLVCGGIEGGLTTHCSEERLTMDEIDEIYNGDKDFIFGEWVTGLINETMTWKPSTFKENEEIIRNHFTEDIKLGTEKGLEIELYLGGINNVK